MWTAINEHVTNAIEHSTDIMAELVQALNAYERKPSAAALAAAKLRELHLRTGTLDSELRAFKQAIANEVQTELADIQK